MAKKKKRGPAKRNKKKTSKYFSASDRDKKGGSLPPCLPASLPPTGPRSPHPGPPERPQLRSLFLCTPQIQMMTMMVMVMVMRWYDEHTRVGS